MPGVFMPGAREVYEIYDLDQVVRFSLFIRCHLASYVPSWWNCQQAARSGDNLKPWFSVR
jgi:hypothetical protein